MPPEFRARSLRLARHRRRVVHRFRESSAEFARARHYGAREASHPRRTANGESGGVWASGTSQNSTEQDGVGKHIDDEHGGAEERLHARRQSGRVDRRKEIVLDETTAIALLSRLRP